MQDRHRAVWEWLKGYADTQNIEIMFGVVESENEMICLIPTAERISSSYINGVNRWQMDFLVRQIKRISTGDAENNIENMCDLSRLYAWIENAGKTGRFPDLGERCFDYQIVVEERLPMIGKINNNYTGMYQFSFSVIHNRR